MWRFDVNGTELYDARARMWSPALGTFLSVDELVFHDPTSTLWAWPNQNPITFSDPFGRDGTTSNPIQDLVDSGFLPPGLTIFGKGTRLRATGISMMANDATVEAGIAKMNCGNAMIAAGAGVLATDAQVIGGIADAAIGAANALRGGGSYRAVRSANTGGEVHHMPSWNSLKRMGDSNPFSHGSAPGILMEKGDHMLTASWGRGLARVEDLLSPARTHGLIHHPHVRDRGMNELETRRPCRWRLEAATYLTAPPPLCTTRAVYSPRRATSMAPRAVPYRCVGRRGGASSALRQC